MVSGRIRNTRAAGTSVVEISYQRQRQQWAHLRFVSESLDDGQCPHQCTGFLTIMVGCAMVIALRLPIGTWINLSLSIQDMLWCARAMASVYGRYLGTHGPIRIRVSHGPIIQTIEPCRKFLVPDAWARMRDEISKCNILQWLTFRI